MMKTTLTLSFLLSVAASAAIAGTADVKVVADGHRAAGLGGGDIRYVVRVTNAGPDAATDVVVNDTFSEGARVAKVDASQGSASGAEAIEWKVGTLAPGTTATMNVAVTAPGVSMSNAVRVAGAENDPNRENNSATVSYSRPATRVVPMIPLAGAALLVLVAARGVFRKDQI